MATELFVRSVPRVVRQQRLWVERRGIRFWNVDPTLLRIEVDVHNPGPFPSRPTRLELQVAPLGAFVKWTPLTSVPVPRIEAGQSVTVETTVAAPVQGDLGGRVPPRIPLQALDSRDEQPRMPVLVSRLRERILSVFGRLLRGTPPEAGTGSDLTWDPAALLPRGSVHWAGNINVLIGHDEVERHQAKALRIDPGKINVVAFFVGEGRDAFQFELQGAGTEWGPKLHRVGDPSTPLSSDVPELSLSQWYETERSEIVLLSVRPPEGCRRGKLNVLVTQRSTGRTAIVEFGFSASALGPGCYTA